jgi:predicted ATP-grasp superfamily ATP-dependent carboligase
MNLSIAWGPVMKSDVLILDASLRQALAAVRSLGSRGLRVAALDTSKYAPAFASRWCQQKFICSAQEGTMAYLAFLEQIVAFTEVHVLFPSSDGTIALLRQYRDRLEQHVRIALTREPALGIAINKERTLEIANNLGIDIPLSVRVKDSSDLHVALQEIGLPAVVKPVESWIVDKTQGGRRVEPQLVTTYDEALCAVDDLTCSGNAVLFQKFLSGRRESVSLFYADGEVYGRFAQWVKRADPPLGGTSVLRQTIAIPADTGEQAERLVRAIGLEGYSQVQFRRDEAGKPYLMEINPRLNGSVETAVAAGIDFPYMLYQWASDHAIDAVHCYQVGTWSRYLWGDMTTTVASLKQRGRPGVTPPLRSVLDFCASFFRPMKYDYWDAGDPFPLGLALLGWLRDIPGYMGKLFSGNKQWFSVKHVVKIRDRFLSIKKGFVHVFTGND